MHEIFIARQNGFNKKLIILTLEEIETILSEAKPSNTKRITACGVLCIYSFVFLLVKFNDFNTAVEMHIHVFQRFTQTEY